MSLQMKTSFRLVIAFAVMAASGSAFGWGEPHPGITKAALNVLPPWQRELLGGEDPQLAGKFCLIPDNVDADRENARFAAMESRPGEAYLLNLHLPAQQPENLEAMRYFMGEAVGAVHDGRTGDAARYMSTICHHLEDYGSPSHTLPGDNQFTLLQQFLPATEAMKDKLLHGPIENATLNVEIRGYKPVLLGTSVEEASWRLLHRVNEPKSSDGESTEDTKGHGRRELGKTPAYPVACQWRTTGVPPVMADGLPACRVTAGTAVCRDTRGRVSSKSAVVNQPDKHGKTGHSPFESKARWVHPFSFPCIPCVSWTPFTVLG